MLFLLYFQLTPPKLTSQQLTNLQRLAAIESELLQSVKLELENFGFREVALEREKLQQGQPRLDSDRKVAELVADCTKRDCTVDCWGHKAAVVEDCKAGWDRRAVAEDTADLGIAVGIVEGIAERLSLALV